LKGWRRKPFNPCSAEPGFERGKRSSLAAFFHAQNQNEDGWRNGGSKLGFNKFALG